MTGRTVGEVLGHRPALGLDHELREGPPHATGPEDPFGRRVAVEHDAAVVGGEDALRCGVEDGSGALLRVAQRFGGGSGGGDVGEARHHQALVVEVDRVGVDREPGGRLRAT